MKGIELLFIGMMVVLVAVAVPAVSQTAYAAEGYVDIERLLPADSAEVETGAAEIPWMLMEPTEFSHDTGRIERLLPADSPEVETGAGEAPWLLMEPVVFSHDTARIELLLPSD